MSDTIAHVINLLALGGGDMLLQDIIRQERARGFTVIRPGEADWLPLTDWKPSSICSRDSGRVRIVLIEARTPHAGAFTRLIDAIGRLRLLPVVIEPHDRLADTLHKWGWRQRLHGHGERRERIWYPREMHERSV